MDSGDDQGRTILSSIWTLTGLALVFLVARCGCKFSTRRGLWWDDYVMILSWVSLTASVILATISVNLGVGKHVYAVNPANFLQIGFLGNFTGTFSILAAVWSKTSFALTLLRLMQGKMKVVLWVIIVTMNVAMTLNALFLWVRCSPVSKTWDFAAEGTCWAPNVYTDYGMFAAGYSSLMDFVLAFLPWRIVWNLQMKKKEKFGVAIAMSLGVAAGATAIVKTVEIPTLASGDFTYASTPLVIWGAAESAVTIMAASIPVLRVLLKDVKSFSRRYQISNLTANSAPSTGNTETRILKTQRSLKNMVVVTTVHETMPSEAAVWQGNAKRETAIYGGAVV